MSCNSNNKFNDSAVRQIVSMISENWFGSSIFDNPIVKTPECRYTALHAAAADGYEKTLKYLLTKKVNLNIRDENGLTPLHFVSSNNGISTDLAKLLINKGANVNAKDKDGNTPLHWAVDSENKEMIELLLTQKGIDVNAKNQHGYTPLYEAARNFLHIQNEDYREVMKEIMKLLVQKGADINIPDMFGDTALHEMAHKVLVGDASKEDVKFLIELGADVNAQNQDGRTPLYWAIQNWNKEMIKLLVQNGADPNVSDMYGNTVLHEMVSEIPVGDASQEDVEFLIEHGADVNAKNQDGRTPLHLAVLNVINSNGSEEMIAFLRQKGAKVHIKDSYGFTPRDYAEEGGADNIVKLLEKKSPLISLVYNKHSLDEIIDEINRGADIDEQDFVGRTSLHYATSMYDQRKQLVGILLGETVDTDQGPKNIGGRKMVNIDAQDIYGSTALHFAVRFVELKEKKEVVKLLIEHGANVNIKNESDETPLDIAIANGHEEIAALLKKNGALLGEQLPEKVLYSEPEENSDATEIGDSSTLIDDSEYFYGSFI